MEKIVTSLSIGLASRGHNLSVYCYDGLGSQLEVLQKNNIPVRFILRIPGIDWSLPPRLARFLKEDRVQILHCHNDTGFFYGSLAARMAGVPVVYTEHSLLRNVKWIKKRVHSMFFRGTAVITAVTDEIAKRLIEEENAPRERVHVIWNGVDGYKYRPRNGAFITRKKTELGIPPKSFVLGTVGRCSEEKNQNMLLDILSLTSKEQSWFLVIVGDGPLREKLEIYAAEKGIREKVKFTGIREDTEEIYPTFDAFLLSSNREGMPLAVIEAMACALPVVSTDVGGIKNIVLDDRNGYLVPPGNIAVMMDRLERLRRDADLKTRFGDTGRIFFEKYLSEEGMIEKYEQLFREILPL